MATVDEYVKMAEGAQKDNAHVAVLMYYRSAIEETGYNESVAPVLLAAVRYAQRLKKVGDREAIVQWSQEVVQRITPRTDLVEIINKEIAQLRKGGGDSKNATTP